MLEQGKILKYRSSFIFKKYKKKFIIFNKKKNNSNFANCAKKSMHLGAMLYLNKKQYISKNIHFLFRKNCNFKNFYYIKTNFKKAIINVFFKKNNNLKNDLNALNIFSKKKMIFKFIVIVVKYQLPVFIKIKKNQKVKRRVFFKKPFFKKKIFKKIVLLFRIYFFIFKKKLSINFYFNKSHSKRTFKLKKKTRK